MLDDAPLRPANQSSVPPAAPQPVPEWQPCSAAAAAQSRRLELIAYLVGTLSHELKNALSPISVYAQLELGRVPAGDPLAEHLQEILDAVSNSTKLLATLQRFAQQQFGPPRIFRLSTFLAAIEPELRRELDPRITLETLQGGADDLVYAEPYQLAHVVRLLLARAQRAMPAAGRVTIATRTAIVDEQRLPSHLPPRFDTYRTLAISDTGAPIPATMLKHYCDVLTDVADRDPLETLEMATVYTVLRRLHCGLSIVSQSTGTTITIFVPLARTYEAA